MDISPFSGEIIVLGGLAKTGTTLPLTLLDSHPDLLVFPEELRFFQSRTEQGEARDALQKFLNEPNVQLLKHNEVHFSEDDYSAHGGSGFGKRDYSKFDFEAFEERLLLSSSDCKTTLDRFLAIINAFRFGCGRLGGGNEKFVCKAPNNERFAKKWVSQFPKSTKFLITTRLPTEHYLSKKSVDSLSRQKDLDPLSFSFDVMKNVTRKWSQIPGDRLLIVDYDRLIDGQVSEMDRICTFLNIDFDESVLTPTKMGVPWSGNSIRGIAKEEVFRNPHKAHKEMYQSEIAIIEDLCAPLYERMGWQRIWPAGKPDPLEHNSLSKRVTSHLRYLACKAALKIGPAN